MEPTPASIAESVLSLVADYTGCRREQLNLDTALNQDLGVDGDDACELLDAFAKKFGVDLSRFHYDRYFGSEAGGLPVLGFGSSCAPLTIRDLVQMVDQRTWGVL
jgi:acyl carrier protein